MVYYLSLSLTFYLSKLVFNEYNCHTMDILKVGNNISVVLYIANLSFSLFLIHYKLENLKLSDTYVTSIDGAIKISLGDSILVQTVR